jgi:hypothetical protein
MEAGKTIFIDRGALSNEEVTNALDNEGTRIRLGMKDLGYYVQNIIYRTNGHPCLIVECRAWQRGDETNFSG